MTGSRSGIVEGRARLLLWVLLAAVVLTASALTLWTMDVRAETGLPLGAHDFIQHVAAFDVAMDGGDPYDDATLRDAENALFPRYDSGAQRFWYPPYVLVVLAPVVALPFELASATWFVANLAGGLAVIVLSWRLVRGGTDPIPPAVVGLGLLFVPLLECLTLGQLGVLVAGCLLGGTVALRGGSDTTAGVLLALTAVRPHTVLLPLVVLGVHIVATRRWKVVRAGLVTVAAMVGTSVVLFPTVWRNWDPIGGSPTHFRTPTIASWLRSWLDSGAGPPEWPLVVVPAVAVLAATAWAVRHRDSVQWRAMPALLAASVLVSPYAWIYDSMLLMPIHVLALARLSDRRGWGLRVASAAVLIQVGGLLFREAPSTSHEDMIVIPIALLCLYGVMLRMRPGHEGCVSTANDADEPLPSAAGQPPGSSSCE